MNRKRSREDDVEDLKPSSQEATTRRSKRQRQSEYVPIAERKRPPEELVDSNLESPQDRQNNNSVEESPLIVTSLFPSSHFAHQSRQAPTNAVDLPVGHQEAPASPRNAENVREDRYLTFTIDEAWQREDIARYHRNLTARRSRNFRFLFANLSCQDCCFPDLNRLIPIGDSDYVHHNENTNRWFDGDFISAFSSLTAHYAHKTFQEIPRTSVLLDIQC